MGSKAPSQLFTPLKVGNVTLKHRVVLAPLTRIRATATEHVPHDFVAEYYSQRGSTPGTLLITEATFIAPQAGGYPSVPGLWSKDQLASWKNVTDAVHAKGSFIFAQLWALGRAAVPSVLESEAGGPYPYVSASDIPLSEKAKDGHIPRPLTIPEIKEYVSLYAQAAENAIEAGFDGVEIHNANGYLPDQFLQDVSNKRTDEYGGSIENRSRFSLEIADAIVKRIGAERVGIRISPWSEFQEMKMADPVPQFTHLISSLAAAHPTFAYLHAVEPRIQGNVDAEPAKGESLDFARKAWAGGERAFLTAGGYTPELALKRAQEEGAEKDAIVFGRWFISNPDLPKRIEKGIPLTPYNRATFYKAESKEGYIDYPFADATANL